MGKSDAAGLLRAATVVWDGRDIVDGEDVETEALDGADGGFATGAGALDAHVHFLETVSHGLAARVLGDNL